MPTSHRRRLIPFRNYNSDTATSANMPVGFENSAMKMSFSLSSLQPSSASLESPEHARLRSERPYNSLTKKPRNNPEQEAWRRSWGSREENKDEFWAALQPNYNYLMDNHLIDSCKEANGELLHAEQTSSFLCELNQLKNQFAELYTWLNNVQEGVYGKEENVTDRSLRVSHMEEMQRNSYRRQSFNDLSSNLLERSPNFGDEVSWRVSHLNSKWEMLEQVLTPVKSNPNQKDSCTDVEHEVRCLRKWLSEMEQRLEPLDFRTTDRWTHTELDEKAREHMVLQRDVESHGKIVCSVVKLCERAARSKPRRGRRAVSTSSDAALGVARSLESRWHHLFLRSLEWSCMIEALADKLRNNSPSLTAGTDSDEGPASKYPRLSQSADLSRPTSSSSSCSEQSDVISTEDEVDDDDDEMMDTSPPLKTPPLVHEDMVGPVASKGLKRRGGSREQVETSVIMNGGGGGYPPKAADVETGFLMAGRKMGGSLSFNKTNREAPNYATFYFKHADTDSEQDAHKNKELLVAPMSGGSGNEQSSSEEEWTFTDNANDVKTQDTSGSSSETATSLLRAVHKASAAVRLEFSDGVVDDDLLVNENNQQINATSAPVTNRKAAWKSSRESIQRLVSRADEMVMPPGKSIRARNFEPLVFNDVKPANVDAKNARINEWLKLHPQEDRVDHPVDSCDASGEYTTGDSDADKSCQSSDELNDSVATCRQILLGCTRSGSSDAILEDTTSPLRTPTHVVMRTKRRQAADRPWSVSGIPQLDMSSTGDLSNFSISESALHQMGISPQHTTPVNRLMGSGLINVSSSTIDATPQLAADQVSRTGSLRRRKLRLKKRTMGRKSESGSDGVTVGHSNSGGSDSQQVAGNALSTNSPLKHGVSNSDAMLKDTSSDDDDHHHHVARRPSFKLGPEGGSVSCLLIADKLIGVEEHHSSLSGTWDNYQEKYMSEPYSEELADSESARRLLEFGDDYRNFMDSQSDCASSLSANQMSSPASLRRRKPTVPGGGGGCGGGGGGGVCDNRLDSDSDLEDLKHVILESRSQLGFSEHVFNKQFASGSLQLIQDNDFKEIIETCSANVKALKMILENVEYDEGGLLSAAEIKDIFGMIERWETLQANAEDLKKVRGFQKQMVALKDELQNLASRVDGLETNLADRDQLESRIAQVTSELSSLNERKSGLLKVNAAVHSFLINTGHPAAALKDDVADLYRVWDETFQSVSLRLKNLQQVSTTLQQFDVHLGELQVALRSDLDTLNMLDTALQGGDVTLDVATSVRVVAKVLSEKQEHYHEALVQKTTILDDSTTSTNATLISSPLGSTEGSLSDSGISDEGSEQELSERERRLEALRRLARHLEGVLAPGSAVLVNMAKRIEQTENELRGLQRTCRDLIVRTAVCVEARTNPSVMSPPLSPLASPTLVGKQGLKPKTRSQRKASPARRQASTVPDDDDADPDKSRSWFWRVLRAALPFQMALVALFCVACLLEPHCCDSMNNLSLSLTPAWRLRGPPPV